MSIIKSCFVTLLVSVFILSQSLVSFGADMDEKDEMIKELKNRLDQLEGKVDTLNKKLQAYEEKPPMTVSDELLEKKMANMMAKEKEKTPTIVGMPEITGYVDTTYNYNFNNPPSQTTVIAAPGSTVLGGTNLSSYVTRENDIRFNTAHLAFNGTIAEDVSYVVEIDAGMDPNITTAVGGGVADNFDIQEAFLTVPIFNTGVKVKAGKFVTLEGIEVIESPLNPTISRGYLFGLAEPFTHVGFLATMPLPAPVEGFELRAGVVNAWDRLSDNNEGKTFIGGIGLNFGDLATGGVSVYYGPEQAGNNDDNRASVDITIFTKPFPEYLPNLTVGLQGNWGNEHGITFDGDQNTVDEWYGFGIQPIYQITDKFSLGGRIEYMYNDKATRFGGTNNGYLTNFTITPGYKITDNVTARVEYRYDVASRSFFETGSGVADNEDVGQVLAEVYLTF